MNHVKCQHGYKRKQTSDSAGAPAAKKSNRRATVEQVEDEEAPPIVTHLSNLSFPRLVINHAKRQHSSEPLTASGLDDEDTNKSSAVISLRR